MPRMTAKHKKELRDRFNTALNESQRLADWIENHPGVGMSDIDAGITAATLVKFIPDNPYLAKVDSATVTAIAKLGYALGYRAASEKAAAEKLLGDIKC